MPDWVQKKHQATTQEMFKKNCEKLRNTKTLKGSNQLCNRACNENSKEHGNKVCKKSRKELGKKESEKEAKFFFNRMSR